MVDARRTEEWNHTASLMALAANINRGRNQRAFSALDFHPVHRRKVQRRKISFDTFERMIGLEPEPPALISQAV